MRQSDSGFEHEVTQGNETLYSSVTIRDVYSGAYLGVCLYLCRSNFRRYTNGHLAKERNAVNIRDGDLESGLDGGVDRSKETIFVRAFIGAMPALEVDSEIGVERHAGDDGHHAA